MTQSLQCLYLTYDGLLDPLGQSQIVPYLKGLARRGVGLTVVSCERRTRAADAPQLEAELRPLGIRWIRLRYHKWPPVLSTAWDILCGVVAADRAAGRWRPQVVHARSYVAGLVALWVARRPGTKFLFDMRGFWPEERVEGRLWKDGGWLFRAAKWWEVWLFRRADAIVILAERGQHILAERLGAYGLHPRVVVIPTCVDVGRFSPDPAASGKRPAVVYVGSVGTWYLFREMAAFVRALREHIPGLEWRVLTNGWDPVIHDVLSDWEPGSYRVETLAHEQVATVLRSAVASLCFISPVSSKLACCPTKVGESLACGVPVVVTRGVGDCDTLIEEERVGITVPVDPGDGYREAAVRLVALLAEGPALTHRCRRVAVTRFDLDRGVERYLTLYHDLIGSHANAARPVRVRAIATNSSVRLNRFVRSGSR